MSLREYNSGKRLHTINNENLTAYVDASVCVSASVLSITLTSFFFPLSIRP